MRFTQLAQVMPTTGSTSSAGAMECRGASSVLQDTTGEYLSRGRHGPFRAQSHCTAWTLHVPAQIARIWMHMVGVDAYARRSSRPSAANRTASGRVRGRGRPSTLGSAARRRRRTRGGPRWLHAALGLASARSTERRADAHHPGRRPSRRPRRRPRAASCTRIRRLRDVPVLRVHGRHRADGRRRSDAWVPVVTKPFDRRARSSASSTPAAAASARVAGRRPAG